MTLSGVMRSDNRGLFWWTRIPRWACRCTLYCTACVCHLVFFSSPQAIKIAQRHAPSAQSHTQRTCRDTNILRLRINLQPTKGNFPAVRLSSGWSAVGKTSVTEQKRSSGHEWTVVGVAVCGKTGVLSSRNVITATVVPLKFKAFDAKSGGYLKEPNTG